MGIVIDLFVDSVLGEAVFEEESSLNFFFILYLVCWKTWVRRVFIRLYI